MKPLMRLFVPAVAFAILVSSAFGQTSSSQAKSGSPDKKTAKSAAISAKSTDAKGADPVVGKTADGKPVYEGSRGGFYYLTSGGDKSYVKDFEGAKIVGKTADGLSIYEGPKGGRFYYKADGTKVYVKNKK